MRWTAFIFRSILFPVELSGCWQRLPADLARLIVMTLMTGSAYSSSSHRVLGRVIVQVMLTVLFSHLLVMLYMLLVHLFDKLPDLLFVCVTTNLVADLFEFCELLF
jgi:hypothetical protein